MKAGKPNIKPFQPSELWRTCKVYFTATFDGKWLLLKSVYTVRPNETFETVRKSIAEKEGCNSAEIELEIVDA